MTISIVDKMHLLALGTGDLNPTDGDIAAAPVLDGWHIVPTSGHGYRVDGSVTNHPVVRDGMISTSPPLFADLDRGWMRTRNTLYRLGAHKNARP